MKEYFVIGVYDPSLDDAWPWHFHYENGRYLSAKKRVCNWDRYAVFSSEDLALDFWTRYSNSNDLAFEIMSFRTHQVPRNLNP